MIYVDTWIIMDTSRVNVVRPSWCHHHRNWSRQTIRSKEPTCNPLGSPGCCKRHLHPRSQHRLCHRAQHSPGNFRCHLLQLLEPPSPKKCHEKDEKMRRFLRPVFLQLISRCPQKTSKKRLIPKNSIQFSPFLPCRPCLLSSLSGVDAPIAGAATSTPPFPR